MNYPRLASSGWRPALTLLELLVVLAVVLVCSALLLPLVSVVRSASASANGVANLRQIGTTIILFAAANDDELPYAFQRNVSDFSLQLSGFISGTRMTYHPSNSALNHRLNIFQDPSARISGGGSHYSAHPLLMPSVPKNTDVKRVQLSTITRPAELILLMDGSQSATGLATATASKVSRIKERYSSFNGNPGDPLPVKLDFAEYEQGHIRWDEKNGTAAKFLFVDGHVEVRSHDNLRYRNILAD